MHLQVKGILGRRRIAQALGADLAQGDGFRVSGQGQAIEAVLKHLDVCAGVKGVLAAGHVFGLDHIAAVQAVHLRPGVALADHGDFEFIARVEVDVDGEGVELAFNGLQAVVVLRPDLAPGVIRVAGQRAGQHPRALVDHGALPGHEQGGVLLDGLAVIGAQQRGRDVDALQHIAFLCIADIGDGFALGDFKLIQDGHAVAVHDGDFHLFAFGQRRAAAPAG